MSTVTARLTVYFDEPFWVGVYERADGETLEASRIVFGAEPKDYDVYEFLLRNWGRLRFSPPVARGGREEHAVSPKRAQRAIRKQLSRTGTGTKAQQALQLQREASKLERAASRRQRTEEEKQRRFDLKQLQKKEKHRGR